MDAQALTVHLEKKEIEELMDLKELSEHREHQACQAFKEDLDQWYDMKCVTEVFLKYH